MKEIWKKISLMIDCHSKSGKEIQLDKHKDFTLV